MLLLVALCSGERSAHFYTHLLSISHGLLCWVITTAIDLPIDLHGMHVFPILKQVLNTGRKYQQPIIIVTYPNAIFITNIIISILVSTFGMHKLPHSWK